MKMVFRWFGEGNDTVPLNYVKQIPGVEGIVWSLHHKAPGEMWSQSEIEKVKNQIEEQGFHMDVVESVNIHEDIKLGLPTRDEYIENYKETIRELGKVGVKVICYNFMPVFDWVRTELFQPLGDGSTALFYEKNKVENMDPDELVQDMLKNKDMSIPGWEPERLEDLKRLFALYKEVDEENLWSNLQYFLEEIIPVAEENDIKMAIHPDDPPWSVFGLPRIVTSQENIRRLLNMVDSPSNGLTFCSGSLGANLNNDLTAIIREFSDRIPFAHIRNIKHFDNGNFIETSHRTKDGSIDIYDLVKTLHEVGFDGYIRPDHGRHVFDEVCRPGYGLYDRAMGIMYLWGIWDSLQRKGE